MGRKHGSGQTDAQLRATGLGFGGTRCNPSTLGLQVPGQPGVHGEFQGRQVYIVKPCLKSKTETTKRSIHNIDGK